MILIAYVKNCHSITVNLLGPSADKLCKQFGPRSGLFDKLFDTQM